jgi:heat shock protein HslJ
MHKKIIYYSVLILLIFNGCGEHKKMSEENYVDIIILTSNWYLHEWTSDSLSIIISTEKALTMDFDEENKKISGYAGCNRYFGNYKIEDGVFSTGQLGSTQMFCSPEIIDQEPRFLQLIEAGIGISMKKNFLILEDERNQLIFKPIQK